MSKYIIIQDTRCIAIPAEHGDLIGKIKFVDKKYSIGYSDSWFEWDDKTAPEMRLVNASEIRQPLTPTTEASDDEQEGPIL
jgi:hypothetical protein